MWCLSFEISVWLVFVSLWRVRFNALKCEFTASYLPRDQVLIAGYSGGNRNESIHLGDPRTSHFCGIGLGVDQPTNLRVTSDGI